MEMNFILQLRRFDELSIGNLNPNAIAIYYHLFMTNNRCGWKEWFSESDLWIEQAVGISRRETVLNAINLLKQNGFIDFERGTRKGQPTKYKILPLLNSAKDSGKDSSYDSVYPSGYDSGKDSGCDSDNPKYKHKQKNKEREKTPAPTKTDYAENVSMTADEFSKLVDYFNGREDIVRWCIDTLNDYKGASGKKYKSDYYAIRKWVIAEYEKKRDEALAKRKSSPVSDDFVFDNFGKGIAS